MKYISANEMTFTLIFKALKCVFILFTLKCLLYLFIFSYIYWCFANIFVCKPHVCPGIASDALVVSHNVGAGMNLGPQEKQLVLLTNEPSLKYHLVIF